jgi:hypothetical protein
MNTPASAIGTMPEEVPTIDEIVASQQKLMPVRDVVSSDGRVLAFNRTPTLLRETIS